jgi:hypothetical protein
MSEVSKRRQPSGWSARGLVLVIEGMLAGIGGVFVATSSLVATAIAASAALILALTIVMTQKQ